MLGDHPLDLVLDLEVPTDDRSSTASPGGGCACSCGATYHVNTPPDDDWTCDVCGGDVVQRDDDTEEAVAPPARDLRAADRADHRLLLRTSGKLVVRRRRRSTSDDVFERLLKEIDGRFAAGRCVDAV